MKAVGLGSIELWSSHVEPRVEGQKLDETGRKAAEDVRRFRRRQPPGATPAQARRVFARLAGPRRFHLSEGLGHESFVSRRPAEWREEVGSFLAGLERTSAASGAAAGTAPSAESGRRRRRAGTRG
jgi:hypothetical protein